MEWWKFVVLIVVSYFIGNVYFAKIIARIKRVDVQKAGSGNPGTMNMLRNYGFLMGFTTLILDMLKGVIPALFGFYLFGGTTAQLFEGTRLFYHISSSNLQPYVGLFTGGLSALVGSLFPVIYRFKGGKGVALVYGMYFTVNPPVGLIAFIIGFIYLLIFHYASPMTLGVVALYTIYEAYYLGLMTGSSNITISCLLFAIFFLVWFAHRGNIFRLLIGKENQIDLRKSFKKKKLTKTEKKELKQKEIG